MNNKKAVPIKIVSYPKSGVTWLKFMLVYAFNLYLDENPFNPSIDLTATCKNSDLLPDISWTHDKSLLINEEGWKN